LFSKGGSKPVLVSVWLSIVVNCGVVSLGRSPACPDIEQFSHSALELEESSKSLPRPGFERQLSRIETIGCRPVAYLHQAYMLNADKT